MTKSHNMDIIRNDTAKHYRSIKKLLKMSEPIKTDCDCMVCEYESNVVEHGRWTALWLALVLGLCLVASCQTAHAYTINNYVDAIGQAEHSQSHPYGILARYKHTTSRHACCNTVRHSYKRWLAAGRPGGFTAWLGRTYCPVGAFNDPNGLNRNWIRNVNWFLAHPERA